MDFSIRQATPEDYAEIARVDGASFGYTYSDTELADVRTILDLERFWVATDGDRIVGITGSYPLPLTLVGGAAPVVPGVTWVSVSPTHRRRGILSALMRHQLASYADQGEPFATLTASEGGIYRRFGYGAASQARRTALDRRRARLTTPPATNHVRLAAPEEARTRLPEIHRRWCALTPGAVGRSPQWWDLGFNDRPERRNGMGARQYLLHPDGYVVFRWKNDWSDGDPKHLCWIEEYAVVSPQAHAELWQTLLGLDLVGSIESFQLPLDDPLPHLLADPRLLRTTVVNDGVWIRPLDVAAMLAARRYAVDVEAVLAVRDPLLGDGNYELRGGPDGAECRPTSRRGDVRLPVDVLGSVYLGGHRLSTFAAAGQVEADDPITLRRLDLALLGERAPFHGTSF